MGHKMQTELCTGLERLLCRVLPNLNWVLRRMLCFSEGGVTKKSYG